MVNEEKNKSMPENKPKSSNTGWIIFAIIVALFLTGGILFVLLVSAMVSAVVNSPMENNPVFQKKTIEGKGESEIVLLHIQGVIADEPFLRAGFGDLTHIKAKLEKAGKDPKIKAVILKINSPGGTINSTDNIYHHLQEFRNEYKKPIVAYLDSVAASGGYYLAVGCDEIVSHPTCITGSIGVIMSTFKAEGLMEKIGVQEVVIKSGPHKDIGSIARTMTDEERKILQDIIQIMYGRFLDVVKKGRPKLAQLPEADLLNIADGRIYTGEQALAKGMVDSIGYWEQAIERACALGKIGKDDWRLVQYQEPRSLFQEILAPSMQKEQTFEQTLHTFLSHFSSPQLYYIWKGF